MEPSSPAPHAAFARALRPRATRDALATKIEQVDSPDDRPPGP